MTSLTPALDAAGGRARTRLTLDAATIDRFAPWAIALVVSATLWLVHRDFPVGVAQDDGLYVILAKALATGQGFRFINLPGAPAGVHFPPGYPVFLAALWRLASSLDARLHLFALANIGLLGVAAAGTFLLARRAGLKTRGAAVGTLAGFLMPPALWMGTALLSEPLWLALAIPWLLWAEWALDTKESAAGTWLALGLIAGMVALVRTQSVTLVIGLLTILAMRREWKPAIIVLAGAAAMLLPWQLWIAHNGQLPSVVAAKYGPYAPWLAEGFRAEGLRLVPETVAINVRSIAQILGSMFGPVSAAWIGVVLVLPAMIAGIRRLAARAPVTLVMILAHGAIILIWPFEPRRFVWTSWPFVVLLIGAGVIELRRLAVASFKAGSSRTVMPRLVRVLVRADTALLIAGGAMSTAIMAWSGAYRTIAQFQASRIAATVDWVGHHTDPRAIVATEDETAVFLYTGRHAVPAMTFSAAGYARLEGQSASVLGGVLAEYHPDLAILSLKSSLEAAHQLASAPNPVLRPVDLAGKSVVFQRIR
jgi:hypothetical protein